MTERWQRELKKLGGVQMPPSIGPRIEEGPTGDKLPARRQRIVAGVVAFAVFGAAGTFAFQALWNRTPATGVGTGGKTVVVDLRSGSSKPSATLSFDGVSRDGFPGSTCWQQSSTAEICFDAVAPYFSQKDYLAFPFGTELIAAGDASVVYAAVYTANPRLPGSSPVIPPGGGAFQPTLVQDLGFLKNPVPLYLAPGSYELVVTGKWQQGTEEFTFAITILPA